MRKTRLSHPGRIIPLAFLLVIALGTVVLMLPAARAAPGHAPFIVALFTATSAVCVTGLAATDTATYWSAFGQATILILAQIGGLGIMTGATLLGLLVSRRLGLATRLIAQAETRSLRLGDVTTVLRLILTVTLVMEATTMAALTLRFRYAYDQTWGEALWHGLCHAVFAFNHAGFSTYSDNLMRFARDPFVLTPIMLTVMIGSLGFPVIHELAYGARRPSRWSVHGKMTLFGSALLLLVGFVAVAAYEWDNTATIGALAWPEKLFNAAFHSVMTRSAGFNAVDVGKMKLTTLMVSDALMLIGGGSAGTAGGIKITTFLILGFVVWAEIRGEEDTTAFRRRISQQAQRQALSVVLLAVGIIAIGVLIMLSLTDFAFETVLFEVVSAFATTGLSTGITPQLPAPALAVLTCLMFLGRVGTITVASVLALKERRSAFRYPEERPIVG
ncbi:TrkH family potassium uptake protein [Methylobacterium nodulans]|uniref:Cation transporter n=1 Tax=Methylobacterium nodulans (strain LMG 21967 / CNCM I-2342 / ORS 2060) TaxID=460265 RepID=B8IPL6_METNO|nr:potassium transporter TrkG [Methylobacterium nodulans]ACL62308.1 cation transporter [Methylobacterium nodulans ORS 2060]